MEQVPEGLIDFIQELKSIEDRSERIQLLVSVAEKYEKCVPEGVTKPFLETDKIPGCESEVYMWGVPQPDGTLRFCFAVENSQGISAMLLAYLLDTYLSNTPLMQIMNMSSEFVDEIFGRELSMGKELGFRMMIEKVKLLAKSHLKQENSEP